MQQRHFRDSRPTLGLPDTSTRHCVNKQVAVRSEQVVELVGTETGEKDGRPERVRERESFCVNARLSVVRNDGDDVGTYENCDRRTWRCSGTFDIAGIFERDESRWAAGRVEHGFRYCRLPQRVPPPLTNPSPTRSRTPAEGSGFPHPAAAFTSPHRPASPDAQHGANARAPTRGRALRAAPRAVDSLSSSLASVRAEAQGCQLVAFKT